MFCVIQDPYYDSETYRGDGGDGTGNWTYEKVFIFLLTLLLLHITENQHLMLNYAARGNGSRGKRSSMARGVD